MVDRVYQFTESQLVSFLEEYAGMTSDATGKEELRELLEALAERGEVTVITEPGR